MKLLGGTGNNIAKNKNGENVPHLKTTQVVLVNNHYQHDSRELYTFAPNKSFSQLLDISFES